MTAQADAPARRPLRSRGAPWASALARRLTAWRVPPNLISALSVVFAAAAGLCLWLAPSAASPLGAVACYLGAAAGVQLRLLANLMDGMVAVEGGLGSKTGELWNDLPDRFADAAVLALAGYGLPGIPHGAALGWTAAMAAVITAYVRVLGAAAGAGQHFLGPMAKPHRMAAMTVASLLAAGLAAWNRFWPLRLLMATLALIVLGCAVTIARRLRRIAAELHAA
ncbi:MAG TPA: CDP-alcohol phosphatidyltransferase family protein [Thermoanaerobaculia bacterium]|nr:CDP-alcohol phosphatidyltransferase family protein [Thermoanaerobaculia bacterium]